MLMRRRMTARANRADLFERIGTTSLNYVSQSCGLGKCQVTSSAAHRFRARAVSLHAISEWTWRVASLFSGFLEQTPERGTSRPRTGTAEGAMLLVACFPRLTFARDYRLQLSVLCRLH